MAESRYKDDTLENTGHWSFGNVREDREGWMEIAML